MSLLLVLAYIATIPAANWLIGHWGSVCIEHGPCLIPVLPGVYAPSGVLMVGTALILRDLVQRAYGPAAGLGCIAVGAGVSFMVAAPSIALASVAAFVLSEGADFLVYTPLARRRFVLAIILSCAAGAVADSAAFLWLAFGSLDHLLGQVVGKLYAVTIFLAWRSFVPWLHRGGGYPAGGATP